MAERDNPGHFITRAECVAITTAVKSDLGEIKRALVGEDLQGGLVKTVKSLQEQISGISSHTAEKEKQEAEKKEIWSREKIALLGMTMAIIGIILGHLLDVLW